jgi:transposase
MIYVGIDVASEKHDVALCNENGELLCDVFTIPNNRLGFNTLISTIAHFSKKKDFSDTKTGLEATGHYSNNILNFLIEKRLCVKVFNPLSVNLSRKSQTLRKTKTDKTDAMFLARMLRVDCSKPYKKSITQIAELKTLTRSRRRLVSEISKHKQHISRLITIVFPELKSVFSNLSGKTCRALLLEFPSAELLANANIVRLTNLIWNASKHRFGRDKAVEIRNLARQSVGTSNRGDEFELQHHLRFLEFANAQLQDLDEQIKTIMLEIDSPILTIKGIGITLGATILAEIGDISNFSNHAKLLAFAGLDPSQYSSGKFTASKTPMVKRGSKYLRYALIMAAQSVARYEQDFIDYHNRKLAEGKHYFVVNTHVAKKLIRTIFAMLKNNEVYELKTA